MEDNNFIQSISPEEIEKLPFTSFQGKIEVIEHPGFHYTKALSYLRRQKIIGFDTETRPCFEPHHLHHDVALLQLSSGDKAFLFRLNKLGLRRSLCAILANPGIVKVGAACHDDIRALQGLRFFKPAGFVDLQKIVGHWGISDKSVKKMAAIILGIRISKNQQLSNWEADSLTQAQQLYGATDAWVCREMYLKLRDTQMKELPSNE